MIYAQPGNTFIPQERTPTVPPRDPNAEEIVEVEDSTQYVIGDGFCLEKREGMVIAYCRMKVSRIVDATHIGLVPGHVPQGFVQIVRT